MKTPSKHGQDRPLMDALTANKILYGMRLYRCDAEELHCGIKYVDAKAGENEATLDGYFTADELEAIAAWMRNPVAVSEAFTSESRQTHEEPRQP